MPPLSGTTRPASPSSSGHISEPSNGDAQSSKRPDQNSRKDAQGVLIAPDGGWGWVIVFAVFMNSFLVDGSVGSFGIIYPELLRSFGAGPSVTSLAGSIIVASFLMSCCVAGLLLRRFSSRTICFTGGLITAAGFVVSSFSTDIITFIVTYGILGGFGIGINLLAGNILVNIYFAKKRGIACGIVSSGAGLGVFALAITTEKLLHEYGWRGTMLISAGIMLHFSVFACLLRPLKPVNPIEQEYSEYESLLHTDITVTEIQNTPTSIDCLSKGSSEPLDRQSVDVKPNTHTDKRMLNLKTPVKASDFHSLVNISLDSKSKSSHLVSLPDLSGTKASTVNIRYRNFSKKSEGGHTSLHHIDPFLRKDIFYSGSLLHFKEFKETNDVQRFISSLSVIESAEEKSSDESSAAHRKKTLFARICDPALFCNAVYVPILLGAVLIQMGQFIPNTFIPEYCIKIGLPASDGSIIISILGAVNILGRFSAGCMANSRRFDSLWLNVFGVFMCGVICALFPLCTSFSSLCAFAVGYGYFIGYFVPLQYLILVDYLGIDKLTSAMGLIHLCKGPAALVGPPLAGCVYEWTKDYAMTIEFAAGIFLLAAGVQATVVCTKRCCVMKAGEIMEISV